MGHQMNWFYLERMMRDRQKELLEEVAPEWLMKSSSRRHSSIIVQARHWLGKRLVVWGCWLVGEKLAGQKLQVTTDYIEKKVSAV